MQLTEYLDNEGKGKLNIIAISWTEGRYGNASASRLRSFVRSFHDDIRVIHATSEIDKSFSPLTYVPANFLFDAEGKWVFGDGKSMYLSRRDIREMVNSLDK